MTEKIVKGSFPVSNDAVKKAVVKGNLLNRVKAAEETLAKEEAKVLEGVLPEGHPLKEEVERQKAILGGDLRGLPPGHPLLKMLQASKEAYDRAQAEGSGAEGGPENEELKVKKAKKVDDVKARRDRIAQEEAVTEEKLGAIKVVNKHLDDVLGSIRAAWQALAENEDVLAANMLNRRRVVKVKGLLMAVERGLLENRLSRI